MEVTDKTRSLKSIYLSPLLAGAVAGLSVDITLYPLDTLKTRLQSAQGFQKAGGFSGVYRGLLTVVTTSVPTASVFFVSYEATKTICEPLVAEKYAPFVHMLAGSVGEVLACVIRVPTEIAKQRKQTYVGIAKRSSISILLHGTSGDGVRIYGGFCNNYLPWVMAVSFSGAVVLFITGFYHCKVAYKAEGFFRGVYRGFLSTVLRDLPFSFIQLPMWELLKKTVRKHNDGHITSFQSAVCGSLAGGFAAATTTPLDLAKTRIMLADASLQDSHQPGRLKVSSILAGVYGSSGVRGLFAGVTPRMTAFMIGGFVFFGMYDHSKTIFQEHFR